MVRPFDIEVRDSVFDPQARRSADRKVIVRRLEGQKPLYRVILYLEGNDLPYVNAATYHLHSTFPNPHRTVQRTPSNQNCKLEIWTWGLFEVPVTIVDRIGKVYEIVHRLSYDREFEGLDSSHFKPISQADLQAMAQSGQMQKR